MHEGAFIKRGSSPLPSISRTFAANTLSSEDAPSFETPPTGTMHFMYVALGALIRLVLALALVLDFDHMALWINWFSVFIICVTRNLAL